MGGYGVTRAKLPVTATGEGNVMEGGERSVAMEKLKLLKVEYEIYKLIEMKTLSHHNSKYYHTDTCVM